MASNNGMAPSDVEKMKKLEAGLAAQEKYESEQKRMAQGQKTIPASPGDGKTEKMSVDEQISVEKTEQISEEKTEQIRGEKQETSCGDIKTKRKRADKAAAAPHVESPDVMYLMGIMQGKIEALQEQVSKPSTSPLPVTSPSPVLPAVTIPESLRAFGMSTLDPKLFPTARQVKYVKDAQASIKSSVGVSNCFVAVDIKSPVFLPERVLEKTSLLEAKPGGDADSLFAQFTGDFVRYKNECVSKGVVLSLSDLSNFLNRQFVLAVVTGHCDLYGGPGSLLSYHFNLLSRCANEKVATIIHTDTSIRAYLQNTASSGQTFDISTLSESVMTHFLTTSREKLDLFFSEQKALKEKEKSSNSLGPVRRHNNNYNQRAQKPYVNQPNYNTYHHNGVSGYPGSHSYNQMVDAHASTPQAYYQYNQSHPSARPQGGAKPFSNRDQGRHSIINSTLFAKKPSGLSRDLRYLSVSDLKIDGFVNPSPVGVIEKSFHAMSYCRRQPAGLWKSFNVESGQQLASAAFSCDFPLSRRPQLPGWVGDSLEFVNSISVSDLRSHLVRRRKDLESLARRVEATESNFWREWKSQQDPRTSRVTSLLNPGLLAAAADEVGLSPVGLLECFKNGFPAVGIFGAPGVFPECAAPGSLDPETLLQRSHDLWSGVSRFRAGLSDCERDDLFTECMKDVERGWLEAPISLRKFKRSGCIPVKRFPIYQDGKTRYCDDLCRSGTNEFAAQASKIDLPGVDTLAFMASELQAHHAKVGFWKCDHENAYKQIPVSVEHSNFCVVVAQGYNGEWYCFKTNTVLFGSTLAVLSYNLCSRFISCLYTKWFGVPCIAFFDDFSGASPAGAEKECVEAFLHLNEALGFRCKENKTCFGHAITFLGLRLAASSPILIELPSEKRERYMRQISDILLSRKCTVSDADSLYGRLQWAESLVFGRAQKVFLSPISRQKYSRSTKLSARLTSSLVWFQEFLSEPRARFFVNPSPLVDFVAFSDASLEGLGVCVLPREGPLKKFSSLVPKGFVSSLPPGSNAIFVLELIAALLCCQLLAKKVSCGGKQAFLFVDNNASLSSLCKGASNCPVGESVILRFWSEVDRCGLCPWVERVPSAQNLADEPSRDVRAGDQVPFPCISW